MQIFSFKPYYNWNTFNTENKLKDITKGMRLVLNLVISGIPSIQLWQTLPTVLLLGFKPCYNWTAFNTINMEGLEKLFSAEF